MIAKRRRRLIYPLIISFFISVVVVIICVNTVPKYFLTITNESSIKNDAEYYYSDLDNTGVSELIHYYHYDKIFQPTLYIYNENDSILGLWNFFEKPLNQYSVYFGDYNNNNVKELFVFTNNSDSLFLYVIDKQRTEFVVNRKYICKFKDVNTLRVEYIGVFDLHNTGTKELVFFVDKGLSNLPRQIYSYNVAKNQLKSSANIEVDFIFPVVVDDLNNDKKYEIYISSQSTSQKGNTKQSQFIALNENLEYLFEPITFEGGNSKTTVGKIAHNQQEQIIVVNSSTDSLIQYCNLMTYDISGNKLEEITLDYTQGMHLIDYSNDNLFLYNGKYLIQLGADFKEKSKLKIGNGNYKFEFVEDLNGDNRQELIFLNNKELVVVDSDLKTKTRINIDVNGEVNYSIKKCSNGERFLMLQVDDKSILLNYIRNESFANSYFFHIMILVLITAIILLGVYIKDNRTKFKKFLNFKDDEEKLYKELERNIGEQLIVNNDIHAQLLENETKSDNKRILPDENELLDSNLVLENELQILLSKDNIRKAKINFFPKDDWKEVKPKLKNQIFNLVRLQMVDLKDFIDDSNDFKMQFLKHNNYINILIEIEGILIVKNLFHKNEEFNKAIQKIDGKNEIAHFSDIGTIVNTLVPLDNIKKEKESQENKIRLILAEDHDVSLFGLTSLFKTKDDIDVVGTAKNGMEVMKLLKTKEVDIVITDISMPGMDGIELSEQIQKRYPEIKVIVFTMYLENWFVEQLINNGAMGFVSKNSKITELISAVRTVYKGANYYCPQFKSKFGFNGKNSNKSLDSLSKNELEIMKHYANGLNKNQVSKELTVSHEVMDSFIANILLKLKAADEDEIIRIAKKQKYISE